MRVPLSLLLTLVGCGPIRLGAEASGFELDACAGEALDATAKALDARSAELDSAAPHLDVVLSVRAGEG
ncbi:MAG: hypothetical protein JWN04_135, partial [Myxococcaceae bacterium]|nr:hypothetical protein [Myxococcaceae bacterium]